MKQLAKVFNRRTLSMKKGTVDWVLPNQLVGIEIEAENLRNVQTWPDTNAISLHWLRTSDGSLQRGNEYVLRTAMSGDTLSGAISNFFSTGSLHRDPAGSTHIHLNMMDEDDTVDGLRNLCVLMYVFEEMLFAVGDPGRAACGYTNRLITAPEAVLRTIFSPMLDEKPQLLARMFSNEGSSRYYGFNMQALGKHGTVEFRYFPTASSSEELIGWVQLLMSFKKAAVELGNVEAIEATLSSEASYLQFINNHFSSWYELFVKTIPYNKALSNLQTVMASAKAVSSSLDTNVNVSNLKNHATLGKFFRRKKIEKKEATPAVRPDHIHVVTGGEILPNNVDGFNPQLKHILLYDNSMYVWDSREQWVYLDSYDVLLQIKNDSVPGSIAASYVTYDRVLGGRLTEALNARQRDMSSRAWVVASTLVQNFYSNVALIEDYLNSNPISVRANRDGMYRLHPQRLSSLWSPSESPDDYDELPEDEDEEAPERLDESVVDYSEPDSDDFDDAPYAQAQEVPPVNPVVSRFAGMNSNTVWFVDETSTLPNNNGSGGQL